ncbi:hypothetical protein ACG04Q_20775 [Roseateles sp. DXS20W]|uniref:Toxic anion resistance protein n=1 Tax=Pelomonas lactea TaxID=3299030 RepID=A0ABW7GQD3_9BURK
MTDQQASDSTSPSTPEAPRTPGGVAVETSIGPLSAHALKMRDMDVLGPYADGAQDPEKMRGLGEALVKRLVRTQPDDGSSVLTAEMYERLSSEDVDALARGVAEACRVGPLVGEASPLEELGAAVLKKINDGMASIQGTIQKSFSTLSESVRSALGDSLSGLSVMRNALKESSAMGAVRKALDDQERIQRLMRGSSIHTGYGSSIAESLAERVNVPAFEARPPFELAEIKLPPFEETPMGRAAIASEESARQLREVAGFMGGMADELAKLHMLFLTEVIPQWKSDLEESAAATNTTLRQAERGIFWAKWALGASVFFTILMTCWQLWVARAYKLENDAQQDRMELLMTEQLAESKKANQRLAEDAKQMRESLDRMAATTAAAVAAAVSAQKSSAQARLAESVTRR